MILSPEEYPATSTYDLLRAAARLEVGFDHRLLRAILDRGESTLPDFLRFFTEKREDDRIDLDEDLLAIARHLRTPAALPLLIEFARRYSFSFPDELTQAFVELGPASLEPLLALYAESQKASDIAFTLSVLRVHDPRVLELLLEELEMNPFEGAMNLGIYGDPAAKPALEAALARTDDETVRREISTAIDEIDAPEPQESPEAYDIYEHVPEEDEPVFNALENAELIKFLDSPVSDYRAHAAQILGFREETAPRIFDLARTDPDIHVRAECWEALGSAVEEPEIRSAMQARLADTSAPLEERAAIAVALAQELGREEPLHSTILEFYAHPEVRARVIRAMWHSLDRRFSEYIPRHLDDPDAEVRDQAVLAVGWLGIVSQVGRIEKFFDDEAMRDSALYAYALAAPGEVTPARTRSLFRKIEDLAGELSYEEGLLVRKALDDRLQMHGQEPIFGDAAEWEEGEEDEDDPSAAEPGSPSPGKVGRNDPCPCGSGKKYKKCCGK